MNDESTNQYLDDLVSVIPSLSLRNSDTLQNLWNHPEPPPKADPVATAAALKKLLNVGKQGGPARRSPWKRSLNTATAQANGQSLVAQSLLKAKPSPFTPPGKLSEMEWEEEGPAHHWPIDDESIFYRISRMTPSAEMNRKPQTLPVAYCDLNMVMPIIVPNAEIRVLNPDGDNFYNLVDDNPGAHLLFGRDARAAHKVEGENEPPQQPDVVLTTDDPSFVVKPPPGASKCPAVCDIWATFLNVHLGTIRNCKPDQLPEICALFRMVFDEHTEDLLGGKALAVDCEGIYPRPNARKEHRFETRGCFKEDDAARFRILRRRIKRFVLMLWDRFGVQGDPICFDVALSDNCRTLPGSPVRIEIRRYGPLSHPALAESLRNSNSNEVVLPDLGQPIIPKATVLLNELRLEMTHARTADPRWPKKWILARRMPAAPVAIPTYARMVIDKHLTMPEVVYEFANPRAALLQSRFSMLYLLNESSEKAKEEAAASKLSATAVPFYPLSEVLSKLTLSSPPS